MGRPAELAKGLVEYIQALLDSDVTRDWLSSEIVAKVRANEKWTKSNEGTVKSAVSRALSAHLIPNGTAAGTVTKVGRAAYHSTRKWEDTDFLTREVESLRSELSRLERDNEGHPTPVAVRNAFGHFEWIYRSGVELWVTEVRGHLRHQWDSQTSEDDNLSMVPADLTQLPGFWCALCDQTLSVGTGESEALQHLRDLHGVSRGLWNLIRFHPELDEEMRRFRNEGYDQETSLLAGISLQGSKRSKEVFLKNAGKLGRPRMLWSEFIAMVKKEEEQFWKTRRESSTMGSPYAEPRFVGDRAKFYWQRWTRIERVVPSFVKTLGEPKAPASNPSRKALSKYARERQANNVKLLDTTWDELKTHTVGRNGRRMRDLERAIRDVVRPRRTQ